MEIAVFEIALFSMFFK